MDIAKMKQTMLIVTMMVVTVVELVLILNTAQNANVLEEKLAMMFLMHWLEMDIAMMEPIMLNATMMVVTVVELVSTLNTVQNVCAMKEVNQHLTFHVSDLLKISKG